MLARSLAPRWRLVLLLACAAALNYADRAAFSAVLPPLRQELGVNDATLGLLGSLFLWSYAFASPVAGMLADRFSRRRLVLASLAAWSLVTAATGLAQGVIPFAALRVALGLAESLYLPAAIALLADHHDSSTRGRALGIHSLGNIVGVVCGGAFAGAVAQHFNWRYGFVTLGLAGIGLAVFARQRISDAADPAGHAAAPRLAVATTLRYLVATPSFHVLLLKTMLAGFGIWIFLNWLPLYFHEKFALGLGAAGFAGTFLMQGAVMIGLAVGGWVSDRLASRDPRNRMLITALCYLVSAPFLLLFLSPTGLAPVIGAIAIFSLLRGIGEASEKPCLCDVVPACYRATAVGLMNTLATAAGGVGVLLAGVLKSGWGLEVVFAGCAVTFTIAGVLMLAGYAWLLPRDLARARTFAPAAGGGAREP